MISRKGVKLIKTFEGFVPLEYTCVAGKRTIGYGHVLKTGEFYVCGVSEQKAEELLNTDIAIAEKAVDDLVQVSLKGHQRDALVCFVFNVGRRAFEKSTLLKELNKGAYEKIPKQLMRWIYAAGRPCPGLVRRRRAEANLFKRATEPHRSVFL